MASHEIPGITYHYVPLNGPSFERALLWRLSWSNLFKLLSLMAIGRRLEAISILGSEVMSPRGLTGLALDTLANSAVEIGQVLNLLADEQNYPVMIHC